MEWSVVTREGRKRLSFEVKRLIVVGFAGRDVEKTMEHIRELEAEGIKCPKEVPVVYECSPALLTQAPATEVVAGASSGEVEYLVLKHAGKTYIGLGSDHTDRALEAVSIHKSKQLCAKPIAREVWDYEEIAAHFASIRLVASQTVKGEALDYQAGATADLLPLETILAKVQREIPDLEDCVVYTGTVPLKQGFKFGERFSCALIDEAMGRRIDLVYDIRVIEEH
ncbi:MAG: DUF2848 domain-containing protein [Candidatus Accumulibacter sp.]|jgi:hypothetical protein|nr:DUF2848 domain-containing protein [Accumulibacter sp.]